MPLMTKEDENLYNILKAHDENGILIDEEQFSELADKKTPVELVLAGLTERTSAGRMLGYKLLEDRENEINEAYAAAEKERSNPDPSFNAAGMDELYDALEKEQRIENYTEFPSKDEFMQLKLNEKVKLVEDLIEGATERGAMGYIYDASASILGAQQYGTKMDRERALYSAAKALDSMLPAYQERNPNEPNILPYAHRDIMNKLYGDLYREIEGHLEDSSELPPRSEFYAMSAEERNNKITQLMEDDNQNALTYGVYFTENKINEILQKLNDIDRDKDALTMDQWIIMDKFYGKSYENLIELSNNPESLPTRGEFFAMSPEERKELVVNLTPEDIMLDLNGGFSPNKDKKEKILQELEATDLEYQKLHNTHQMDVNSIDQIESHEKKSVEYIDLDEAILTKSAQPKRTNPYMPADVYVDHEAGERIQLKSEQTKEGVLFKFPEEPYDTLIIEKGNEKTGFRFEPTKEAIEKKENITIETPCLDADGKEIPGKFEKLIFNPATNEMLLHKIPDGFNSRLDQEWLAKFEDKTPKIISRSRVTMGANQETEIHELSETNLNQHNGNRNNQNIIDDSLSVSSLDDDKENLNQNANQAPKISNMRKSLTAPTSTKRNDSTKKPVAPAPHKVAANMQKQTAARANSRPQEIAAYLETEDGKFSLGKDSAGNFVLGSQVIIKVKPNGKDFEVKGKGKYIIDVPTSGGNINRHSYDKGKKTSGPTLTINPINPKLNITIMDATRIDPPSSGTNISMNNRGDRELL